MPDKADTLSEKLGNQAKVTEKPKSGILLLSGGSSSIMKDTAVIAELEETDGKHLEELIEIIDSSEKFDIITTKVYDFTKGKHETVAVRIEPDDAGYKI